LSDRGSCPAHVAVSGTPKKPDFTVERTGRPLGPDRAAAVEEGTPLSLPRPSSGPGPPGAVPDPVRPAHRHLVGTPPTGARLRLWADVLAPAAGLGVIVLAILAQRGARPESRSCPVAPPRAAVRQGAVPGEPRRLASPSPIYPPRPAAPSSNNAPHRRLVRGRVPSWR
jgi:hypothetical protein